MFGFVVYSLRRKTSNVKSFLVNEFPIFGQHFSIYGVNPIFSPKNSAQPGVNFVCFEIRASGPINSDILFKNTGIRSAKSVLQTKKIRVCSEKFGQNRVFSLFSYLMLKCFFFVWMVPRIYVHIYYYYHCSSDYANIFMLIAQ